ncbi:glycosyl transferase [Streptomyces spiroverticillatus]|uniref:Glycosyl transferase n=1 Tax=Streptomyces finlayi TaxID=67296 RepID=A0A918WU06_9ACTN|nr:glycosyltransferase family 4 protein [Streptomyces finlayi]GGZ97801.1 glycosyl transferase [Streptomyces spiroverticillatus]GHC82826.1 glycosyl transferase [Streptomyces finlayi]
MSGSLRIALVHSFYGSGQPSGENQAVLEQERALRAAGHEVLLAAAHTDQLAGGAYPLKAAARVATGRGATPLARLREWRPDVVHVHNLFPNYGRSWVREWRGPLVATLHNYRPLCAAATLYREGAACTRCLDGERWAGLKEGCYRGSRLATLPLAWAGRGGPGADALLGRADRLVVLSELSRRTYEKAGVAPERLALVPNFVTDAPAVNSTGGKGRWVFAGRLGAEKGVLELLRRWPDGEPLDVVGDGELAQACRAAAPSSVRFVGALGREELRRRMPSWRGLVFPSRCLENAPLVYAEALAAGLPVLAFTGSSVAEALRTEGTGAVTGWDTPLAAELREAAARFPGLRAHCARVFAEHYREPVWLGRTQELYASVVRERGAVPCPA